MTDWNMPNMDGLTLLQTIRATPSFEASAGPDDYGEAKKENIIAAARPVPAVYRQTIHGGTLSEKLNKIFENGSG